MLSHIEETAAKKAEKEESSEVEQLETNVF